jgi:peptidoglycan/LPS O-acetylase OafA/YrhL
MTLQNKIPGFDSLRGLAIISVLLTHLHVFKYLKMKGILAAGMVPLVHGRTDVQIFFVLSGFLITLLLIREFDQSQGISLKKFYLRRILRIVPVYTLFLLLVTLLYVGRAYTYRMSSFSLLFAYTYLYNFIPKSMYSGLIGHTWSLAVEEHFYLLWPVIFLFFRNRRGFLMAGMVVVFVLSNIMLNLLSSSAWITTRFFVDRWTPFAGSPILVGCFLALLLIGRNENVFARKMLGRKVSLFAGFLLYAHPLLSHNLPFYLREYITSIGIGLIIGWIYLNPCSRWVKVLEFPPLNFIGVISYGLYVYQGFYLGTGPERSPDELWPPSPLAGLLLLFITAPLSYYFFEKPFLRLKAKYSVVIKPSTIRTKNDLSS